MKHLWGGGYGWYARNTLNCFEVAVIEYVWGNETFTPDTLYKDLKKLGFEGINKDLVIKEGVQKSAFIEVGDGLYQLADINTLFPLAITASVSESVIRNTITYFDIRNLSKNPLFSKFRNLNIETLKKAAPGDPPDTVLLVNTPELVVPYEQAGLPIKHRTITSSGDVITYIEKEAHFITFLSVDSLINICKIVEQSYLTNYKLSVIGVRTETLYGEITIPGNEDEIKRILGSPRAMYFSSDTDVEINETTDIWEACYRTLAAYRDPWITESILRSPVTHCFAPLKKISGVKPLENSLTLLTLCHKNISTNVIRKVAEGITFKPRHLDGDIVRRKYPEYLELSKQLRYLAEEGYEACPECKRFIPSGQDFCPFCGALSKQHKLWTPPLTGISKGHTRKPHPPKPLPLGTSSGYRAIPLNKNSNYSCNVCESKRASWKMIFPNQDVKLLCNQCFRKIDGRLEKEGLRKCTFCGEYVKKYKRRNDDNTVFCEKCYIEKYWEKVGELITFTLEKFEDIIGPADDIMEKVWEMFKYNMHRYFLRNTRAPSIQLIAEETITLFKYEWSLPIPIEEIIKIIRSPSNNIRNDAGKRKNSLDKRVRAMMREMYLSHRYTRKDPIAALRMIYFRHN